MTKPSLGALETFVAVAHHGSFNRAAAERGVSASALSHAIRGLEEAVGVRLFNRTNRSIHLTEAGEHLLRQVAPALTDVGTAIEELAQYRGQPAGTLRLNVPRNAVELVIRPIMAEFLTRYPDVQLEIVTDDAMVDIVGEGFDAGIREERLLTQEVVAVPVGPPLRYATVASPQFFERTDIPAHPDELASRSCIVRRYPNGRHYRWRFGKGDEDIRVDVSGRLIVDDRALIIPAALDGLGIAHIHESLVEDHIRAGTLVRVLEDWCPPLPPLYLYYAGRRHVPATLRAFIDMARTMP